MLYICSPFRLWQLRSNTYKPRVKLNHSENAEVKLGEVKGSIAVRSSFWSQKRLTSELTGLAQSRFLFKEKVWCPKPNNMQTIPESGIILIKVIPRGRTCQSNRGRSLGNWMLPLWDRISTVGHTNKQLLWAQQTPPGCFAPSNIFKHIPVCTGLKIK